MKDLCINLDYTKLFSSLFTEHRHFLETVHYAKNEAVFALTTNDEVIRAYG